MRHQKRGIKLSLINSIYACRAKNPRNILIYICIMTIPDRTSRDSSIDAMRAVAFCGVVCIHTVQDRATMLMAEAGRFAVPLFFALSGYFLSANSSKYLSYYISRIFKRIILTYLFWFSLYFILSFFVFGQILIKDTILHYFLTGGSGYHLWFLPSLAFSLVTFVILRRYFSHTVVFTISIIGYSFCAIISTYKALFGLAINIDAHLLPFYGLAFVAFGNWARNARLNLSLKTTITMFLFLLFANSLEYYVISIFNLNENAVSIPDIRFMAMPLGFFALILATKLDYPFFGKDIIASIGRVSLGMYAVHLAFIIIYDNIEQIPRLKPIELPVIVIVLSATISYFASHTYLRRFFS